MNEKKYIVEVYDYEPTFDHNHGWAKVGRPHSTMASAEAEERLYKRGGSKTRIVEQVKKTKP